MPYNEEALNDAYNDFKLGGYTDTREDFSKLLTSNPDAFKDAYSSFTNQGYNGSGADFAELLGLKTKTKTTKKEEVEEETTDEIVDETVEEVETPLVEKPASELIEETQENIMDYFGAKGRKLEALGVEVKKTGFGSGIGIPIGDAVEIDLPNLDKPVRIDLQPFTEAGRKKETEK